MYWGSVTYLWDDPRNIVRKQFGKLYMHVMARLQQVLLLKLYLCGRPICIKILQNMAKVWAKTVGPSLRHSVRWSIV